MALRLVDAPTSLLVSLSEAKAQLRVTSSAEDAVITRYLKAAQAEAERLTQRRYAAQTLEWILDGFCDDLVLPVAGAGDASEMTVDFVKYVDLQGVTQTLDPTAYWVSPAGPSLRIKKPWTVFWPILGDGAERLVIRFSIADPDPTAHQDVAQAIVLLVAHWYANREAVVGVDARAVPVALPLGVTDLLPPPWNAS
ncbi:MAG TPA: head-tail connector protein [Phenylobacterium sp.]|nr:head-tail connector protein [Phenylobacterium sp.]